MKHQIEINWQQAQEVQQEVKQDKQQAITDFLECSHEMTDARDLLFYSESTGKDIYWLIQNGKNLSPLLSQPLLMGADIDDLMHVDIFTTQEDEEEETPDMVLLDGRLEVFFYCILTDVYIIYLEGKQQAKFEGEKKTYTLNECKELNPKLFIEFAAKNNII